MKRLFSKNKKSKQSMSYEYWVTVLHYKKCRSKIVYKELPKENVKEDYVVILKGLNKSKYSYWRILADTLCYINKDFESTCDWSINKIYRIKLNKVFLQDTVLGEDLEVL